MRTAVQNCSTTVTDRLWIPSMYWWYWYSVRADVIQRAKQPWGTLKTLVCGARSCQRQHLGRCRELGLGPIATAAFVYFRHPVAAASSTFTFPRYTTHHTGITRRATSLFPQTINYTFETLD